jgi:hypothetical protein
MCVCGVSFSLANLALRRSSCCGGAPLLRMLALGSLLASAWEPCRRLGLRARWMDVGDHIRALPLRGF